MSFITYSQNFEDVILWRVLHDVGQGHYIDIGAHDPVVDSVSLAFYEKGWRGIHVEPTPTYAAKLREARPDEIVIEAAVTDAEGPIQFHEIPETGLSTGRADIAKHHCKGGFGNRQIVVPSLRLDKLLEMAGPEVHWLKIDVEGMEGDVLRSWGESSIRPWMVVVEATYPGTQKSTKDLWIDEVIGRGYREIYFDGVSCYFLHEEHDQLAGRFLAPPNVFDDFQVTAAHFSAWTLKDALAKELDRAWHEAQDREAKHAQELASVRSETEAVKASMQEVQAARAAAAEAHAASEREHRIAIDRAWRERQEAESVLLSRWNVLEDDLRGQLASVSNQRHESDIELATLRERTAQLDDRLEELRQQEVLGRQRITELEKELVDARNSSNDLKAQTAAQIAEQDRKLAERDRELVEREHQIAVVRSDFDQLSADHRHEIEAAAADRAALSQQLTESAAMVAKAHEIIRKALAEPLDGWQRLGRALALSRGDSTKQVLRAWGTSSTSTVETVDAYMSFIPPGEGRNPYLRANSLPELLSWGDMAFVRCAYVTILGRQPDPDGEAYYTDRIRSGYSKMHVLWQLRTSVEGPRHDPGIAGLDRALRRARRARMPIIGPLFGLLSDEEGNGKAARRHRLLVNRIDRLEAVQGRLLHEQGKFRALLERPSVILPAAEAVENDGHAVVQNETGDRREPSTHESPSTRALSTEAKVLFHSFTGAR